MAALMSQIIPKFETKHILCHTKENPRINKN